MRQIKKKIGSLALMLSVLSTTTVYGVTSDDVRRFVGKPEIDTIEMHDYLDYASSILNGESKETLKNTLLGKTKELSESEEQKYAELKASVQSGTPTAMSKDLISNLIGICKNLKNYKSVVYLWDGQATDRNLDWYLAENNIINNSQEIEYMNTLTNDTFDIGGIGAKSQYPIKSNKLIVTGGFKGVRDDMTINGTYFYSTQIPSEQAVQSMTNGVVTEIHQDETWGNWLKVQSGKGITVSYSLLDGVLVNAGDTVQQGTLLSKGTNTGEVYVEVKLDGNYINPCILLGENGIEAHNEWFNGYPSEREDAVKLEYSGVPDKQTSTVWEAQGKPKVVITENKETEETTVSAWSEAD